MKILLERFIHSANDTIGRMLIDDKFMCYTLEDEKRDIKVHGETRIPEGEYKITLRTEGGFHQRYLKRFGEDFHKGMLWVRDIPGFEFILIHTGNTERDTDGCILVGREVVLHKSGNSLTGSTIAYTKLYPIIRDELIKGNEVTIKIYSNNGNGRKY